MDLIIFLQGLFIGFIAAAPVGAVAVLTIQRTINKGFLHGFVLGAGSALGDFFFASIAAFGISFISDFLIENRVLLGILGSIFLIFIGLRIFSADPIKQIRKQRAEKKRRMLNDFITSLIITLSNPITIIGFGGLFAMFSVFSEVTNTVKTFILLGGVLMGSLLWWTSLTTIVNIFRNKIRLRNLIWINKITGILVALLGFGIIIGIIFFRK